jgi:hypothetical protein
MIVSTYTPHSLNLGGVTFFLEKKWCSDFDPLQHRPWCSMDTYFLWNSSWNMGCFTVLANCTKVYIIWTLLRFGLTNLSFFWHFAFSIGGTCIRGQKWDVFAICSVHPITDPKWPQITLKVFVTPFRSNLKTSWARNKYNGAEGHLRVTFHIGVQTTQNTPSAPLTHFFGELKPTERC